MFAELRVKLAELDRSTKPAGAEGKKHHECGTSVAMFEFDAQGIAVWRIYNRDERDTRWCMTVAILVEHVHTAAAASVRLSAAGLSRASCGCGGGFLVGRVRGAGESCNDAGDQGGGDQGGEHRQRP